MTSAAAPLVSSCLRCGAHLVWRHTPEGRVVALDATPVPDGCWVHTGRHVRNTLGVARPEVAQFDPDQLLLFGVSDPERHQEHTCA